MALCIDLDDRCQIDEALYQYDRFQDCFFSLDMASDP